MTLNSLANLEKMLRYQFLQLGLAGWVGLGMMALALILLMTLALPAHERIAAQEGELAQLRLKANARAQTEANAPLSPVDQLAAFYKEFPNGASVPDWLGKLYGIADDQEIELDRGDYVLTKAAAGRLDQFRITLPVNATYPQVKGFIAAALASTPALALEGVAFKREAVDEDLVNARVVFRLYLEKAP